MTTQSRRPRRARVAGYPQVLGCAMVLRGFRWAQGRCGHTDFGLATGTSHEQTREQGCRAECLGDGAVPTARHCRACGGPNPRLDNAIIQDKVYSKPDFVFSGSSQPRRA